MAGMYDFKLQPPDLAASPIIAVDFGGAGSPG